MNKIIDGSLDKRSLFLSPRPIFVRSYITFLFVIFKAVLFQPSGKLLLIKFYPLWIEVPLKFYKSDDRSEILFSSKF